MSSGFITESEVLEQRRQRQEEWDKVRTEDQPKEAPEEPYDTRPLFTRLEEQRLKKEAEYEEAHKLKNMIRGLDDDEVGFLDLVEQSKAQQQHQITLQEQREMDDFRSRLRACSESEQMSRLRAQLVTPARNTTATATANAQHNKLSGVIVRKRKASEAEETKDVSAPKQNGAISKTNSSSVTPAVESGRRCVGVLPGLGHYQGTDSSSDSDSDSNSDDTSDKCCSGSDLLGRPHEHKKKGTDDKS